jgi:dTDP-4-dehydrorhamnose reductase
MRVLVTGAGGQVGQELSRVLSSHIVDALTKEDMDITNEYVTAKAIDSFQPEVVIHTAAYTNVDGCERDPETAIRVNSEGTRNVAVASRQVGASLVYISTDYVFDGTKGEPYVESDTPNPLGWYGRSKLAGEENVRLLTTKHQIVRTAWVFGNGNTFVRNILRRAAGGQEMFGVTDEVGSPTWARDLAIGLSQLIEHQQYGTFHLTNSGSVSRYDYMTEILRLAEYSLPVVGLDTVEFQKRFPLPTRRPQYSVLANQNAAALGITLRPWRAALKDFLCTLR